MDFKLILFLLAFLSSWTCCDANQTTDIDVVILGAGMAGLTAANYLNNNGIKNYLVLEAQNYVGGRLKNLSFGGITVGEGANWVHYVEDGDDNPLLQLTNKLKLKRHIENIFDIEIKNAPGGLAAFNKTIKAISDAAKKIAKDTEEMPDREDETLRTSFANEGWKADTGLKSSVEWFLYDFEYAVKTDMISTYFLGIPETNAFVIDPRGYATVIEYLAKNVSEKIKTGKVVNNIKYDSKGVQITTNGNNIYKAKYALCTFSTGVLGSNLVNFVPELPSWKREAVNKIPQAYYTHIFVKFSTAFWEDKNFILNAGQVREEYPVIYNLNKKGFHPGSNILIFSVVDDDSLRVENQPENVTIEEVLRALKKMYPTTNISRPTNIFVSKWSTNPYMRGSYSNIVMGGSVVDFHNLEGHIDNLFFAGEGCDEEYYGYLQGAYNTGLRESKVIASCLKGDECAPYQPEKKRRCVINRAVLFGGTIDLILLCVFSILSLGY